MSDLTKKILESGLVDEATASLMERWGLLDEGSSDMAKQAMLKNRGREQLMKFADSIEEELEKARKLRETNLDLNQLKWPVEIFAIRAVANPDHPELGPNGTQFLAGGIHAVIDRLGRYYFRPQEVQAKWLVPGFIIEREVAPDGRKKLLKGETILEVSELYVGDQVAAIQVSTQDRYLGEMGAVP
jgi:hypothetical protein